MNIRKILAGGAFALSAALMASSASAVTIVSAPCGSSFSVPSQGTAFTGNTPDPTGGGAGSCTVTFTAEYSPLGGDALATIGNLVHGQYTGLTMSWISAVSGVLATTAITPFVTSLGTTFTSPDDLVQAFTIAWTGSQATAAGFDYEIVITTPEPGSLALLGLGLLGIGAARRRKLI